jgi:hypothetical protein
MFTTQTSEWIFHKNTVGHHNTNAKDRTKIGLQMCKPLTNKIAGPETLGHGTAASQAESTELLQFI